VGTVLAIFAAGEGAWIGGSHGLQFFDGQHFREIIPAGGRSFGSVSGVWETSDGSLWLNSFGGIVRIAPAAVSKLKAGATATEYSIFDALEGLPGPPATATLSNSDASQRWEALVRKYRRTCLDRSQRSTQK